MAKGAAVNGGDRPKSALVGSKFPSGRACGAYAAGSGCSLAGNRVTRYLRGMAQCLDRTDRARLRERFYGESLTVLARL